MNALTHRQKLGLIICLNLLLSLPGLWVPYYNIDELTNTLYAHFINTGELTLRDFLGNTYLLTHYLYALVFRFTDGPSMVPIHVVHAVWKCLTVLACYWSGKNLDDRKCGLWCALFYAAYSTCFMSKDFHTPSAESFSLLPAVLCAGFVFRAIDKQGCSDYFLAGIFAAVAAFFKAPMGVLLVAALVMLMVRGRSILKNSLAVVLGFMVVVAVPPLLISPFGEGFSLMLDKISETNSVYIQFHEDLSFLYWFFKFLIRTILVLGACLGLSVFAFYAFRMVFAFKRKGRNYWQKLFFLFIWFLLIWFAVAIGKRVFFHYYVFLLAPLSLLAGAGIKHFDTRAQVYHYHVKEQKLPQGREMFSFLEFVRRHLVFFMVVSVSIFFMEGALNLSTKPGDFTQTIRYLKENTKPSDHIYVWGNIPQLYIYAQRQPSTVYFWSDILAGTSPGSPAMEYVRATGKKLKLNEWLSKDFEAKAVEREASDTFAGDQNMAALNETELFTVEELVERIDHFYWRLVIHDFLKNPPEVFIDSSPANIRGFGFFPIHKYELLKRFVLDNYKIESVVDGLVIYRLQREG